MSLYSQGLGIYVSGIVSINDLMYFHGVSFQNNSVQVRDHNVADSPHARTAGSVQGASRHGISWSLISRLPY